MYLYYCYDMPESNWNIYVLFYTCTCWGWTYAVKWAWFLLFNHRLQELNKSMLVFKFKSKHSLKLDLFTIIHVKYKHIKFCRVKTIWQKIWQNTGNAFQAPFFRNSAHWNFAQCCKRRRGKNPLFAYFSC